MNPLWHVVCNKSSGKEIATPCFMGILVSRHLLLLSRSHPEYRRENHCIRMKLNSLFKATNKASQHFFLLILCVSFYFIHESH